MDHETTEEIKRYLDVTVANLRGELKADIREVREDLRGEIHAVGVEVHEVKRQANVVAESLRSEIRLVAEGVTGLDEKFTLEFRRVREEMGEQIGEVKSLLKASYGDLDRRVQALERKPS